jgi:hypothetical protein
MTTTGGGPLRRSNILEIHPEERSVKGGQHDERQHEYRPSRSFADILAALRHLDGEDDDDPPPRGGVSMRLRRPWAAALRRFA